MIKIDRLYFDITHTVQYGLNTGIQRSVRNIFTHSIRLAPRYGARIQAVMYGKSGLIPIDIDPAEVFITVRSKELVVRKIYNKLRSAMAVILPFKCVKDFVWAPSDRPGLTSMLLWPSRASPKLLMHLRGGKAIPPSAMSGSTPQIDPKGAALVLFDASWDYAGFMEHVAAFVDKGGHVIGIVCDIIPLTHPQYCSVELQGVFRVWIENLLRIAEFIVCISEFTSRQLIDFADNEIRQGRLTRRPRISYFHLGAELKLDLHRVNMTVSRTMTSIFSRCEDVFIVVGSIDPRKNHTFILDAFDQIWEKEGKSTLVIIGQNDWESDKFLRRVAGHPRLGTNLHLIRNANDADLDYAYDHASALIFASVIEGFGLPIVESIQRGLPVLCSDIPVFREIANENVIFFGLDSPSRLAAAITQYHASAGKRGRRSGNHQAWITWEESTKQLLDQIFGSNQGEQCVTRPGAD